MDYDLTKIKAIVFDVDGVLAPSTIPLAPDGTPMRMVSTKDGYALQLAVKSGLKSAIITGGKTVAIQVRFEALGMRDIFQGVPVKLPVLQQWMSDNDLSPDEVMYMGDDIPDLECMGYVGLPCAPADAAWEAREAARYVSPRDGGYGCVRDVVEKILKAQHHWMHPARAFGW